MHFDTQHVEIGQKMAEKLREIVWKLCEIAWRSAWKSAWKCLKVSPVNFSAQVHTSNSPNRLNTASKSEWTRGHTDASVLYISIKYWCQSLLIDHILEFSQEYQGMLEQIFSHGLFPPHFNLDLMLECPYSIGTCANTKQNISKKLY